jgi:hypothetical protein
MSKPKTTAQNLESRFAAGEDVLDCFDTAKAVRRFSQRHKGQKRGTSNIEHRTSNSDKSRAGIQHRM